MKHFFHKAPFLRIALPFAAGSAAGLSAQPDPEVCLALFALAILTAIALASLRSQWSAYHKNHIFGWLAVLAFFSAGAAWSGYRLEERRYENRFDGSGVRFEGKVLGFPAEKPNSTALELLLIASRDSAGQARAENTKIIAYLHPDLLADTLLPGDRVVFDKSPAPHRKALNPQQFDFGEYLIHQGFSATVYLKDEVTFHRLADPDFSLRTFFEKYRGRAISMFEDRKTAPEELGVIAALVLGKRDMVDAEIRQAFSDAGTVHILAVSGLHVGIVYFFAGFIIGRVFGKKRGRWFRLTLCLAILWLYAGIAGFSPSVLRAATMFSFIAAGREFSRFGNIYNMLGVSAFLLLLIDPFLIASVGFVLSYLAVTGIVMLHPPIYAAWVAPTWLLDKVWSLTVVSLTAQIATLPVTIHFFHQFPNYFLFSNLLVIPLATVLLYAGLLCILFSWIPHFSDLLFIATEWIALALNSGVLLFGKLPHPVSDGLYLTAAEAATLYILGTAAVLAFRDPRRGRIRFAQIAVLLFVLQFGYRKIKGAASTEVYCFHVEGSSVVGIFRGSTAYLYSPDSAGVRSKAADFALSGFLTSRGIQFKNIYEGSSAMSSRAVSVIAVESMKELRQAALQSPDLILFRSRWPEDWDGDIRIQKGTAVVIDGSVPYYRRASVVAMLRRAGVPCIVTAEVGAIRL